MGCPLRRPGVGRVLGEQVDGVRMGDKRARAVDDSAAQLRQDEELTHEDGKD